MNNYLKITMVIWFFLYSGIVLSQESPIRIGLKIGYPNIVGGNIEYVTPLLGNKLSASIDYSLINIDNFIDPDEGKLSYFQVGLNYYLFKEGKGLYGNLSYGILDADVTLYDIESDYDFDKIGTATAELSNKSMNIKIGAKLGGLFYFRPEIGYSFTSLDDYIDVVVQFPDGTSEFQQEEIPSELTQGLLFNIGFGFAF
jgi:hypothetical protein